MVLELLGPADGAFETPMRLRLTKGRMNADVGKLGQGFTVATAAGEVVDLGTRFAVDVSDEGETKTAVFSGQVRIDSVNRPGHRDMSWHLREGEAVRFRKRQRPRRLPSLVLSLSGRLPAEANSSSIIAGVSDNVVDVDFQRFYAVIPGGMVDGAPAYTDNHNQRWRAAPGTAFPAELHGAELVCPFQSDRHALDLKVTVVLSQPGVVYVMHDVRKPAPDWLAKGFMDTGMRLRSGPCGKAWHGKEFDFDVASSSNTTDVVRLFMDACKKYRIAPGLYYNFRDAHAYPSGFHLMGENKVPLPDDDFELVKAQLKELTTLYPECHYYWLDHAGSVAGKQLADVYELLRGADRANIVLFNTHLARRDRNASGEQPNLFELSRGFGFPADVVNMLGDPDCRMVCCGALSRP